MGQYVAKVASSSGPWSIRPEEKAEAIARDGLTLCGQVVEQGSYLPPGNTQCLSMPADPSSPKQVDLQLAVAL